MACGVKHHTPTIIQLYFRKFRTAGNGVIYGLIYIVNMKIQVRHLLLFARCVRPYWPLIIFKFLKKKYRPSFSFFTVIA